MPEGLVISKEVLDEVTPVFRELNLSEAGANKLMPLAGKFHERILDGQEQEHAAMKAEWAKRRMIPTWAARTGPRRTATL